MMYGRSNLAAHIQLSPVENISKKVYNESVDDYE